MELLLYCGKGSLLLSYCRVKLGENRDLLASRRFTILGFAMGPVQHRLAIQSEYLL